MGCIDRETENDEGVQQRRGERLGMLRAYFPLAFFLPFLEAVGLVLNVRDGDDGMRRRNQ